MMTVEALAFRHPGEERILKGVGFTLHKGEVAALLGANGAGKTTLFQCLTGYWRPCAGRIALGRDDLGALPPRERALRLAVVPQEHAPPFAYHVRDVVLMGRAPHIGAFGGPGAKDRAVAEDALAAVGILALAERDYTRISGGERQLVLTARALAQQAPILLLDEPTAHLDLRNQLLVLERICEAARTRGLTVLMTLHDPNLALMFADRVLLLHGGGIVADGRPDAVITREVLAEICDIAADVVDVFGRRVVVPRRRA